MTTLREATSFTLPAFVALLLVAAACAKESSNHPTCGVPGASVACACPDGTKGAQVCQADGTFAPCQCQGSPTAKGAVEAKHEVEEPAAETEVDRLKGAKREAEARIRDLEGELSEAMTEMDKARARVEQATSEAERAAAEAEIAAQTAKLRLLRERRSNARRSNARHDRDDSKRINLSSDCKNNPLGCKK